MVIGGDAGNDEFSPPRPSSTSAQVETLAKGADVIVHSTIHPVMGPDRDSGMPPPIFYRQSSASDLGAMAQRTGAKHLVLTHLIPPPGAPSQGIWKVPGGALTEADYKKAAQDGGFTGTSRSRPTSPASACRRNKLRRQGAPARCRRVIGRPEHGRYKMLNSMKAAVALALLGAGSLTAAPVQAQAQYPNQAVKWVVPFSPGGLPDTVARIVGQKLQERLGQSVVIENRPGAAATCRRRAARHPGRRLHLDGDRRLDVHHQSQTDEVAPLRSGQGFRAGGAARAGAAVPCRASEVAVSTMKEFIDYARANPGKINYGSSGLGTTHHLSMEAVKAALKLDMTHVPFKGTGQSVPALLGGHVEVAFSAYPSLAGAVQANQVKLLATNGLKRSAEAPDVPAVSEIIPGFDFAPVIGVFAKAGTPKAAIDKIAAEAMAVMKMPEVIAPTGQGRRRARSRRAGRLCQGPQGGSPTASQRP